MEWIVYTHGSGLYLRNILREVPMESEFEWKIEGNTLYFRPKSKGSTVETGRF